MTDMKEKDPEAPTEEDLANQQLLVNDSPELLNAIFEKITKAGKDAKKGGELIERETVKFQMDGTSCAPNCYVDGEGNYFDFWVTMRSLTPKEEQRAMRGVTPEGAGEVPGRLILASLFALNDVPIPEAKKDTIWSSFGQKGRQICSLAFAQVGSAGQVAVGKFLNASSLS